MSAKGFNVAEQGHVVNLLSPVSGVSGTATDIFSMKNHAHASIIITQGAVGTATTVTVKRSDDFSSSNTTAIGFRYYVESTAGGDTLGAYATASTAGFALASAVNVFAVIELDASEFTASSPNCLVSFASGAGNLTSVVAILSGSRYAEDQSATAIA